MVRRLTWCLGLLLPTIVAAVRADEIVYRYEGDTVPYDPSTGWLIFDSCEGACLESVSDGHFRLDWEVGGDQTNYHLWIAQPPQQPPPAPFWVEWSFRSDEPFNGRLETCDAGFVVKFRDLTDLVWMLGDTVVSFSGDYVLSGLTIEAFHTHRFESTDGKSYCFAVDGEPFVCGKGLQGTGYNYLQMYGHGGCNPALDPTYNEWDFVRYGTIAYGEQIVSSDPAQGFVDARAHATLDRFTVTYDSPNYVYIDEISGDVAATEPRSHEATQGEFDILYSTFDIPSVVATRRLDNGPPETVEIVLDRPIPYNATTRFTFNDGVAVNVVEFTFAPGDTDGDGDADLFDFAAFQNCFGNSPVAGVCLPLDFNADSALDLLDFAALQSAFLPPGR